MVLHPRVFSIWAMVVSESGSPSVLFGNSTRGTPTLVGYRPVINGAFVDCEAYGNAKIAKVAAENSSPPGDAFMIISSLDNFWPGA